MIALFIIVGAVCAMATLARRLPAQNVIAIAFLVLIATSAAEICGQRWQVPFTPIQSFAEPRLFGTMRWTSPLLWLALIVANRQAMRWSFNKQKGTSLYGVATIVGSSLLVTLFWMMPPNGPAQNMWEFVGRFLTALALQLMISPWLIDKRTFYSSRN